MLECLGRAAGVPPELATSLYRSIDKLDKIGREGVARDLVEAGLTPRQAEQMLDQVTKQGEPLALLAELRRELSDVAGAATAIEELEQIFQVLPDFGVALNRYSLDLTLARGLDYYTGPVFEATVTEPKVGSVGGAGRYDGLVGSFLGRPIPATGMSLGLERIIEVVREHESDAGAGQRRRGRARRLPRNGCRGGEAGVVAAQAGAARRSLPAAQPERRGPTEAGGQAWHSHRRHHGPGRSVRRLGDGERPAKR